MVNARTVVACSVTASDPREAPMKKALTILLLTLSVGLLLQPGVASALEPTAAEKQVIAEVNQERTSRGLKPVRFKSSLTRAARAHSREMARRGVLTHRSACGWSVGQRVRHYGYTASGYRSWSVGENLYRAKAGTLYATPVVAVNAWMDSTGHRAVILTKRFRDIGVGIAKSDGGMRYFTIDLGRRIR
jgi:uncharacterized protein YkwD